MKELICILCPNGCRLRAKLENGEITVEGYGCKRGISFAETELSCPKRSLTTTVKTAFPDVPVLPVRSDGELPKELLGKAMEEINRHIVKTVLACGDTVIENLAGSGVKLIATSNILADFAV